MVTKDFFHRSLYRIFFSVVLFFVLAACSATQEQPVLSPLDTPEHHIATGDAMLRQGDGQAALEAFQRASQLDPQSVPACIGSLRANLILERAGRVKSQADECLALAREDQDKQTVLALKIRGLVLGTDDPDWLEQANRAYSQGMRIRGGEQHAGLNLAMGLAWAKAGDNSKAEPLIARAVALGGPELGVADAAWKRIQQIERAAAGSEAARVIAHKDHISRADMAALLMQELGLRQRLSRDISKPKAGESSDQGLNDYANSPFAQDIIAVNRLGIRGLEIRNGSFQPERGVNRAEMAMMLEDVLALVTTVDRTGHIGGRAAFPDLPSSHFAFNAMMTAVTRGLMEGDASGYVRPFANVTGAEAILAVRRLKALLD